VAAVRGVGRIPARRTPRGSRGSLLDGHLVVQGDGTMTERMWWYPSGRFPNTCRERFNFAGARKETRKYPKGTFQTLFQIKLYGSISL